MLQCLNIVANAVCCQCPEAVVRLAGSQIYTKCIPISVSTKNMVACYLSKSITWNVRTERCVYSFLCVEQQVPLQRQNLLTRFQISADITDATSCNRFHSCSNSTVKLLAKKSIPEPIEELDVFLLLLHNWVRNSFFGSTFTVEELQEWNRLRSSTIPVWVHVCEIEILFL